MWFNTDLSDVNQIVSKFGFEETYDNCPVLHGVDFRFPIKEYYFVSLMSAYNRSVQHVHIKSEENDRFFLRSMSYEMSLSGAGLGRNIMLSDRIQLTPQVMLGFGNHTIDVSNRSDFYPTWDDIDEHFNMNTIIKDFILIYPKCELSYTIFKHLEINAEIGYVYGPSPIGSWYQKCANRSYGINDAPDTKFHGFTVNVGVKIKI